MDRTLNDLCNDFQAIRNGEAIDTFVDRYALSKADVKAYPDVRNLLEVYEGTVCSTRVTFMRRWHDPSQAFSIRPDISKLELNIHGLRKLTTEYPEEL